MPTELEEERIPLELSSAHANDPQLVEFLHHGNTQIRQTAAEHLVSFSKTQPSIFKTAQSTPVKDLKLLVKDYTPIAKNALTILINISTDLEVLKMLADDEAFLETILLRMTNPDEPNATEFSMLLANLAKSPSLERLISIKRIVVSALTPSPLAITQLVELYNKAALGAYNKNVTYDYLAYLFADLVQYPSFGKYLTTPPPHSPLDPLTTFLPFTIHTSPIRRLGTASLLRNLALLHPDIPYLLQPASFFPAILLPLCSSNQSNLSEEEMEMLPEECQYLDSSHKRENDPKTARELVETLWLLCTRGGVEGRRLVKEGGAYAVIRELHLEVEDEGLRAACERVVDVLMGDAVAGASGNGNTKDASNGDVGRMVTQGEIEEEDEENEVISIF